MPLSSAVDEIRAAKLSKSLHSDKPSPSPSKRQKRDEHHHRYLHEAPTTPTKTKSKSCTDNMYKFSSNLIDLTSPSKSASGASPTSQRISNGIRSTTVGANAGPKKLIVKNFRTTTKSDPEEYFNTAWKELEKALEIILSKDVKPFSLEQLYRAVENLCKQDKAPRIFKKLQARCINHVAHVASNLVASSAGKADTEVLQAVVGAWTTWRRQMTTIHSIFYYMDRSYLLHSQTLPTLDKFGITAFRDNVFNNSSLQGKVLNGACELVSQDREPSKKSESASSLFKDVVSMFHILAVYTKTFEPLFLKKSKIFFDNWAIQNSKNLSLAEYISQCHAMFGSETHRCEAFGLDDSTKRNLVSQMEESLVDVQKERLVDLKDVKHLLQDNAIESLESLYSLLEMKRLGGDLKDPFVQYIEEAGEAIVFDEEHEAEMVIRLLLFKRKLDYVCENAFGRNSDLAHSLREAFAVFINKTKKTQSNWNTDNNKPGEMIAKYVDLILRGGSKAIPESISATTAQVNEDEADDNEANEESQINKQLDQVLDLFRFVNGKAVFEAFYKKDLAKRLLMNRSASADAEKSMLDRLSKACGQGFTQNLETMFKDIELAREENAAYKMILEESGRRPAIDLSVNVLSAAAWPTYPDIEVVIPKDVSRAIEAFQEHYRMKHKGRTLDWKHSLAHCQMKARFPGGNKDIVVSSFQAIVMLHFNGKADSEAVTYQELSAATKLPDVELKRTLQSLACAKYRVLTKTPRGKDVNETDKFTVNLSFTDSRTRIKINQIQLKETREENKQTHERVAADRQYETQAAIVRIMKSKKRVKHAVLVTEVIDALKSRGHVNPEDIKQQIEKLIDKDYMERSEDDSHSYDYIS